MTTTRLLLGALVLSLALTGCGPSPEPSATSTPTSAAMSSTPTPAPTEEAPVASAIVVSLSDIAVRDQHGQTLASASFDGADATLAFVSELMGSTPEPVDNRKGGLVYEWPGIRVILNFSTAWVRVSAPTVAGLPVATSQGIHVGSTRAEVLALGPVVEAYDGDGDGQPDSYGLEPVAVPEYDSLVNPGQPGTAYIRVFMSGDTVASIGAPSGDYLDI